MSDSFPFEENQLLLEFSAYLFINTPLFQALFAFYIADVFSSWMSEEQGEFAYQQEYILFGKETKGLPEELLVKNKEWCIRIPMIDEARSLNLSNAVAIGVYEVLRQWDYPELENFGQLHNYKWEEN